MSVFNLWLWRCYVTLCGVFNKTAFHSEVVGADSVPQKSQRVNQRARAQAPQ